jgi:hypothetical protein
MLKICGSAINELAHSRMAGPIGHGTGGSWGVTIALLVLVAGCLSQQVGDLAGATPWVLDTRLQAYCLLPSGACCAAHCRQRMPVLRIHACAGGPS